MNWLKRIIQIIKDWFSGKKYTEYRDIKQDEEIQLNEINSLVAKQPNLEPLNEIIIGEDQNKVVLNRINDFTLDQGWTALNPTHENANFFSQLTGAGMAASAVTYSAQGLYQATVNPASLMTYKSGTLSSITLNGKSFGSHAGFVNANAAVFAPILIFQFASMITGQYYFNGMTKQLTAIQQGINQILQSYHNERIAKIKTYTEKLMEYEKSDFFTLEDFVNIDKMKMELGVIRYEYILAANQQLKESLFPEKTKESTQNYDYYNDSSDAEKLKIESIKLLNEIKKDISSLYKKSGTETVMDGIGNFFENSKGKANKMIQKIHNSKFMFMVEASLQADKLYQYIHFIELKANLSYKNPDENRIGKINQLYKSIYAFNPNTHSVYNDVNKTVESLKEELSTLLNQYMDNSIFNPTDITQNKSEALQQFKKIEEYKNSNSMLTTEREKIKKAFETPTEFIMDNRNGEGKIYVQNQLN
jgi:hypothetical protein